jgi:hypothetical protein
MCDTCDTWMTLAKDQVSHPKSLLYILLTISVTLVTLRSRRVCIGV